MSPACRLSCTRGMAGDRGAATGTLGGVSKGRGQQAPPPRILGDPSEESGHLGCRCRAAPSTEPQISAGTGGGMGRG